MMSNEPVVQKVQEYFLNYIKSLIQSNQISQEMGSEIYRAGQNHLMPIASDLVAKHQYSQISLRDIEVEVMSFTSNIAKAIEQQRQYQQPQQQNNQWGMNMNSHFSNRSNPVDNINYSNPSSNGYFNDVANRNEFFTHTNTEGDFNMGKIEETHETARFRNQELEEFENILKTQLRKSQALSVPNIKNTENGVDINFDKQLYLKLNEKDDISYVKASLSRPYFKHEEVLDWFFSNEKMFFNSKNDKSISLIEMKTYRYKHFIGDNNDILRTLTKSKKHYNTYSKEFITKLKDNSHRAVKIVEILIIERINQLLALYLRSSENFSIRYEIENLDEIEDLLCLDLNKHNVVTEHQKFQTTINKIINESMSWLFGKKDFSMSLLDSVSEENLLKMISTNKIKMSNKLFAEYDYHSLDDDAKEKYFVELNNHNVFMIPEKMLITGYRDVTLLSRFGEQREIVIKNGESYFEIFLSFVMKNKSEMKPTYLCIKRKEDNGFVIFSVGLTLDGDLAIRRE